MHTSSSSLYDTGLQPTDKMLVYRNRPAEIARVSDLMALVPNNLESALDIGARDGHLSRLIVQKVAAVTALDLECPRFSCEGVSCVQGNATNLQFANQTFDLVFCAEVLEHIPGEALEIACAEMARVARKYVLIGVPYKQDLRQGKTTCYSCGTINPPWGHVNSFDEKRLADLFPTLQLETVSFVGSGGVATNRISAALMTYAGNPYGTYVQEEGCVHCGHKLVAPPRRSISQKVATKLAVWLDRWQIGKRQPRGNWIHVLFRA